MDELKQELDQAYKLAAALTVSGDAVEVLAGIRAHLRRAWALAGQEAGKETGKEAEHG